MTHAVSRKSSLNHGAYYHAVPIRHGNTHRNTAHLLQPLQQFSTAGHVSEGSNGLFEIIATLLPE